MRVPIAVPMPTANYGYCVGDDKFTLFSRRKGIVTYSIDGDKTEVEIAQAIFNDEEKNLKPEESESPTAYGNYRTSVEKLAGEMRHHRDLCREALQSRRSQPGSAQASHGQSVKKDCKL